MSESCGIRFVDAVVLTTSRMKSCLAFYRALGLPLAEDVHGDPPGPTHYECDLGQTHFGLFHGLEGRSPAPGYGGATLIGLRVDDLDESLGPLRRLDTRVLVEPEEVPWGRRAVVLDPDGRRIELNQARRDG